MSDESRDGWPDALAKIGCGLAVAVVFVSVGVAVAIRIVRWGMA